MTSSLVFEDVAQTLEAEPVTSLTRPSRFVLDDGVSAVTMPSGLAVQVDAFLTVRLMRAPILRTDGDAECTLLAGPPMPLRRSTQDELIRMGVRLLPAGTLLILPTSGVGPGEPQWWGSTTAALNGSLPPQSIVIAACRSIADSAKGW